MCPYHWKCEKEKQAKIFLLFPGKSLIQEMDVIVISFVCNIWVEHESEKSKDQKEWRAGLYSERCSWRSHGDLCLVIVHPFLLYHSLPTNPQYPPWIVVVELVGFEISNLLDKPNISIALTTKPNRHLQKTMTKVPLKKLFSRPFQVCISNSVLWIFMNSWYAYVNTCVVSNFRILFLNYLWNLVWYVCVCSACIICTTCKD